MGRKRIWNSEAERVAAYRSRLVDRELTRSRQENDTISTLQEANEQVQSLNKQLNETDVDRRYAELLRRNEELRYENTQLRQANSRLIDRVKAETRAKIKLELRLNDAIKKLPKAEVKPFPSKS